MRLLRSVPARVDVSCRSDTCRRVPTGGAAAAPQPATPLNGLALLWRMVVSWLRSLFGVRGA
ncbi:MAG TPA: hypothetical protein VGP32_13385 [Steroidobacteraceae bacterium]|nr:hypothetical protein [Steroidobacteraceae bacterium]